MKVIDLKEVRIKEVLELVVEIIYSLNEDYELDINVSKKELEIILREFYDYYEKKQLVYMYKEQMIDHFEDIAITAVEYDHDIDIDFLLTYLKLFELLESEISVHPKETKKVIGKIKKKIRKER